MLTSEHLDTAAIHGDYKNLGLRRLGLNGRILNPEHAQNCIDEIAEIIGSTDTIGMQSVRTDWNMNQEELRALLSLAFICRGRL